MGDEWRPPSKIANEAAINRRLAKAAKKPTRTESGQQCPKCGGTQFVPRRKTSTKIALGVFSLAGRPHHVECVTCGHMFKR